MAYYFEEGASHEGQSDARAFSSVLDALYWAIMTLTVRTVCLGLPGKPLGRLIIPQKIGHLVVVRATIHC